MADTTIGNTTQIKNASRPVSRVLYGLGALRHRDVAAIHLGRVSPRASCNLPGRRAGNCPEGCPSMPSLFGLAPGVVCRAAPVARRAVGSYPTLSPLPDGGRDRSRGHRGGLLSVALSLGSPPPDVIRHRVSMEPGLSSPAAFRLSRVRPPGRLAPAIKAFVAGNATENPAPGHCNAGGARRRADAGTRLRARAKRRTAPPPAAQSMSSRVQ